MYTILLTILVWLLNTGGVDLDSYYTGGSDIKIDNVNRSLTLGDRAYLTEFDSGDIVFCADFKHLTCYVITAAGLEYTDM